MFLVCKNCGSIVAWENLHLGHLDRDVYNCTNKKCPESILHYLEPNSPLPKWIKGIYAKAN